MKKVKTLIALVFVIAFFGACGIEDEIKRLNNKVDDVSGQVNELQHRTPIENVITAEDVSSLQENVKIIKESAENIGSQLEKNDLTESINRLDNNLSDIMEMLRKRKERLDTTMINIEQIDALMINIEAIKQVINGDEFKVFIENVNVNIKVQNLINDAFKLFGNGFTFIVFLGLILFYELKLKKNNKDKVWYGISKQVIDAAFTTSVVTIIIELFGILKGH